MNGKTVKKPRRRGTFEPKVVDMDLLKVHRVKDGKKTVATVLGWGDPIQVGP